MSTASGLVVPIAMWGRRAPTHCVTVLYLLRDQRTLVTGSADGQVRANESFTPLQSLVHSSPTFIIQVIVWDVDYGAGGEWMTTPRHVLVAHTAPVRCVTKATAGQDCHTVVSSSENGEMFVWDTVDGRVIESKKYPQFVHTSIQGRPAALP